MPFTKPFAVCLVVAVVSSLVTLRTMHQSSGSYPDSRQIDDSRKFIASMTYGRLSNRYFQIKIMVHIAYLLNRTLVLLPYKGVDVGNLFDINATNQHFSRYPLVITWTEYIRIARIRKCLCVSHVYDLEDGDPFDKCVPYSRFQLCTDAVSNPVLGSNRVVLKTSKAVITLNESFMLVSGRWVWEHNRVQGLSELLSTQSDRVGHFHLNYTERIWNSAKKIHQWLSNRDNSSNHDTLAIHIRLDDLPTKVNLASFLRTCKDASIKHRIPHTQVFIATDGNFSEIKQMRKAFTMAQIECPNDIESDCKHPVRKLFIMQAVAAKATHFLGTPSSTFTGVINVMRAAATRNFQESTTRYVVE